MTVAGVQLPKGISLGPSIVAPNSAVVLAYTKAVRDGREEARRILGGKSKK